VNQWRGGDVRRRKTEGVRKMTTVNASYATSAQGAPNEDEPLVSDVLSLDLVAALSGDRRLSESERELLDTLQRDRGDQFYSDVLYVVTHRRFPPSAAADLWNRILQHKCHMSYRMERNVRIAVASLDYLSNLTGELHSATVIDESHVTELVRLSQHDGLTGLFNHAYCYQRLDAEVLRYERYGTVVSLMMIDIDDFKALNDHYGHVDGDQVLAALGAIIQGAVREPDICCRYGGEEFAVILPSTNAPEASALAERLRAEIARAMPSGRSVTVSIGVASSDPATATSQALARRADAALYQAKHDGKDRVVINA
jgi:two-component system, cell cycle response regulator